MFWRVGYLFNDPLEDTEIYNFVLDASLYACYLFNDPLEDTEISCQGLAA